MAVKKTPKTNRRSRKLRIGSSHFVGGEVFEPKDEDWSAYERALGKRMVEPLRLNVRDIVQDYFDEQPLEQNAPFLEDVVAAVADIGKRARELKAAFRGSDINSRSLYSAARSAITQHCQPAAAEDDLSELDKIDRSLTKLITGASLAIHHLNQNAQNGFVEGKSWDQMIRRLREMFRQNGLPFRASHDTSKTPSQQGSPFERFIDELQTRFEQPTLRRHHGISRASLAKFINRTDVLGH